ncbi:hypothetical protein L1987_42330 [Smallanthus sonchifolius]|uniref:Uncharacterized protein n=1 Tax=Smallanthus sonchifolius TaxID=185202 RepID=A0ACB9GIA0_9ASTR|nr:hypothetical protein L1987_42330 [Smallanthus sonchifolius]
MQNSRRCTASIELEANGSRAISALTKIKFLKDHVSIRNCSQDMKINRQYKTSQYFQTVAGISHISFGGEEPVSPKRALSEAKQRELSGTLDNDSDSKLKKQFSNAKNKELSGHDIFAPPPEIQPRPLAALALALRESISIGESAPNNVHSKKIPSQKFTELSGNNIFKGDEASASAEKPLSSAKLREMSGSNIFADGKAESRDYLGARKPPGGESSIALV